MNRIYYNKIPENMSLIPLEIYKTTVQCADTNMATTAVLALLQRLLAKEYMGDKTRIKDVLQSRFYGTKIIIWRLTYLSSGLLTLA